MVRTAVNSYDLPVSDITRMIALSVAFFQLIGAALLLHPRWSRLGARMIVCICMVYLVVEGRRLSVSKDFASTLFPEWSVVLKNFSTGYFPVIWVLVLLLSSTWLLIGDKKAVNY